jgi:hypothetical protein
MHKIYELSKEQLADFVCNILTDILKKEYPATYSGVDILTCMQFELKQKCACGNRYLKIRETIKDII